MPQSRDRTNALHPNGAETICEQCHEEQTEQTKKAVRIDRDNSGKPKDQQTITKNAIHSRYQLT